MKKEELFKKLVNTGKYSCVLGHHYIALTCEDFSAVYEDDMHGDVDFDKGPSVSDNEGVWMPYMECSASYDDAARNAIRHRRATINTTIMTNIGLAK
jgi:hypothetical protein